LHGIFAPGRSLGGVRLRDSPARVVALWGRNHGVCRACTRTTWYYNYTRYEPQGAGVEFARGRVAAVFTLWSPTGWRTPNGLQLGDPASRIAALYGPMRDANCGDYDAQFTVRRGRVSVFYVQDDNVWGFGLSRPSISVCR
jgi:hypothetical protein